MRKSQKAIRLVTGIIATLALSISSLAYASDSEVFKASLNAQLRFDERSGKDPRTQYRLRWYPQYNFSNSTWSLNGFVSTGDDFSGSHNTISASYSDHFFLRRVYLRYQSTSFRTEFGVIPTYKGKVSSSGLSKNGFIKGIRLVSEPYSGAELELVVGSLDDTSAIRAMDAPKKLDYFELELSTEINDYSSFELSFERMTDSNFLRSEYRLSPTANKHTELYLEWIKRLDNEDDKIVLGVDSIFNFGNRPFELQGYYTYVSNDIGLRAELTEDFISTGHGMSLEVKTPLNTNSGFKWVSRFDSFQNNTRFILGIELKI